MGDKDGIVALYDVEDAHEFLYNITIFGRTIVTTVTNHKYSIREWVQSNQPAAGNVSHVIGLDASITGVEDYSIATVHICTGDRCLIIQLNRMSSNRIPQNLKEFFSRADLSFTGNNLQYKLDLFYQFLGMSEMVPKKFVDLGDIAVEKYERRDLYCAEVVELFNTVIGRKLNRPELEDIGWDAVGPLTIEQVHCACLDAFACFELGRFFREN